MDYFNKKIAVLEQSQPINTIINNPPKNIPKENVNDNKNPENVNLYKQENLFSNTSVMPSSMANDIQQMRLTSGSIIPKKIKKEYNLPVTKSSPDYVKLKEEIIAHIEDGICELEYFNIDHAKEHVESALYYLRNIKK